MPLKMSNLLQIIGYTYNEIRYIYDQKIMIQIIYYTFYLQNRFFFKKE